MAFDIELKGRTGPLRRSRLSFCWLFLLHINLGFPNFGEPKAVSGHYKHDLPPLKYSTVLSGAKRQTPDSHQNKVHPDENLITNHLVQNKSSKKEQREDYIPSKK